MGYTTEFTGRIEIQPPLNPEEIKYLKDFAETRRMNRNLGPYFTDTAPSNDPFERWGQQKREDVIDYNSPFPGDEFNLAQPGLWCQWVPTEDGTALVWDRGEKFYSAEEWMRYLIDTFLKNGCVIHGDVTSDAEVFAPGWIRPSEFDHFVGHDLNGVIKAQGEDPSDRWDLIVKDNEVSRRDEED